MRRFRRFVIIIISFGGRRIPSLMLLLSSLLRHGRFAHPATGRFTTFPTSRRGIVIAAVIAVSIIFHGALSTKRLNNFPPSKRLFLGKSNMRVTMAVSIGIEG
jgi:hypothetical protein